MGHAQIAISAKQRVMAYVDSLNGNIRRKVKGQNRKLRKRKLLMIRNPESGIDLDLAIDLAATAESKSFSSFSLNIFLNLSPFSTTSNFCFNLINLFRAF